MTNDDYEGHLGEGVIAAYVDRRLGDEERRAVESHLADCDPCRAEVREVARLVRGKRRPWVLTTAGLGVAAAAAVVVIALLPREGIAPGGPVLRDGSEAPAAIVPILPSDSGITPRDSIVLAWHPVGPGVSYRATVTNTRGDVLWSGSTPDTAAVPVGAFEVSTRYYWSVDGLLPDGRTATTGMRSFRTGP